MTISVFLLWRHSRQKATFPIWSPLKLLHRHAYIFRRENQTNFKFSLNIHLFLHLPHSKGNLKIWKSWHINDVMMTTGVNLKTKCQIRQLDTYNNSCELKFGTLTNIDLKITIVIKYAYIDIIVINYSWLMTKCQICKLDA